MLRLTSVALRLRDTQGYRPMETVGAPDVLAANNGCWQSTMCSKVEHAIQAAMVRRNAGGGATSSCLQCVLTRTLNGFAIDDVLIASGQCSTFPSCGWTAERHSIASTAILSLRIPISHARRHAVQLR
jgi:hypothetical protein